MRQVIFLQSKFPNNMNDCRSLLERWESYDHHLKELNDGFGIQVIALGKPLQTQIELMNATSMKFHFIESGFFVYLRSLMNLKKTIHGNYQKYTLICGDHTLSVLASLICRVLAGKRLRVQMQFHGNTYSLRNNPGLRGLFRVVCSKFAVFSASSIRVVSSFQIDEIRKIRRLPRSKFVIAPIPIDGRKLSNTFLENSSRIGIAIIGRLHFQRGVSEMIEIVSRYLKMNPNYSVTIAGEGPLKSRVCEAFKREIEKGQIKLVNNASSEQLAILYANHKVMLSCAPNEGYGLAIREAVLNGLRVVAKKSKGTIDAREIFGELIYLYDGVSDANKGLDFMVKSDTITDLQNLRIDQEERDKNSLNTLVRSWT